LSLLTFLHGAETFLRSWYLLMWSRNSLRFMEPEDSLRCSQSSPCPKWAESSPHLQHPISFRSSLLSSHLPLLKSTSRHLNWYLPFRFSVQNFVLIYLHAGYMPCPAYSTCRCLAFSTSIISPSFCYFQFLWWKCSQNSSVCVLSVRLTDQVSHIHKRTGKIVGFYISVFRFLIKRLKEKQFWTELEQGFTKFSVYPCTFGKYQD
jgi:hypothetical protein